MTQKLLVITAGTVAAGVGLEFMKQIEAHPASELEVLVRYIDTANLLTRYSGIHHGEWFQMTINPQYMDAVRRKPQNYPELNGMLFPNRSPEIQGSGAGSIRYNAASALVINRKNLKEWLTNSITELVKSDEGQVELAVAVIVSAVGATGSGSLERLIDLIVDCSQAANIPSPLQCDVFILQPGMQGVTDLGLSNTLTLYAEMASSKIKQNNGKTKSYRGRTVVVGWGSERYMASIDQLKEEAATLIRITHDPSTEVTAEFIDREVDNHVLTDFDKLTELPSHLSTATAVTISLGDLEERIIKRDSVRLVDTLVFGADKPLKAGDDYIIPGATTDEHHAGPLMSQLADFLQGNMPEEQYRHLVERLTEQLSLRSLTLHAAQLQGMTTQLQAARIRNAWQYDKEEMSKGVRSRIEKDGLTLVNKALAGITEARRTTIANGGSLLELYNEYLEMEKTINSALTYQPEASVYAPDDREVMNKIHALTRANKRTGEQALQAALHAVHEYVYPQLQRESRSAALKVLHILRDHCAESRRNLKIVLDRLWQQRENNPKWNDARQKFHIDKHHLLHLPALSSDQEIESYANMVSVFASTRQSRSSVSTLSQGVEGEQQVNQVDSFHKWLEDEKMLDALFSGDIEVLLDLAERYAYSYVHSEVEKHSVVDVLLQAGEEILMKRLRDASVRASSLVPFNKQFADERREKRLISAYCSDEERRVLLQKAINQAFGQGECELVNSKDPSEMVVFYCVDGLPMSAINALTGPCLEAFMMRSRAWYGQGQLNGSNPQQKGQQIGIPVYSGKDAQERVQETRVIYHLYEVRGQNVDDHDPPNIPELDDPKP